jgi:nucleoid-associated protein YgaU
MSALRLTVTTAAMAVIALFLSALTPGFADMAGAVAAPQRTADTLGPDQLVLSAAGLLAWAVWGWGALGLALTAASAVPGALGSAARLLLHGVLPAGARRTAALALGVGLGVAGPLTLSATGLAPLPAAMAAPAEAVPDWPTAPAAVPDWPAVTESAGAHVVLRGDCLWHIAEGRLADRLGRPPTDGEVAAAVHAWWTANADVIGPDPDLILPGQVLRPPP